MSKINVYDKIVIESKQWRKKYGNWNIFLR